jgi:serine/threonine protein kinase
LLNFLFNFFVGEPPWAEFKNPMTVLYQIYNIKEPPAIPEFLSSELRDFISCCLKIEPKDRWNVYQLLRHPFITGDMFTFHNIGERNNNFGGDKNMEFENKFYSEERNTRYTKFILFFILFLKLFFL